jgi:hypothetical protein
VHVEHVQRRPSQVVQNLALELVKWLLNCRLVKLMFFQKFIQIKNKSRVQKIYYLHLSVIIVFANTILS